MKQRILGLWRHVLPRVRVGGIWKDIDSAWIKVNGVFKKFKYPFVAKGITITLAYGTVISPVTGVESQRRSFIYNGGQTIMGSSNQLVFNIDGVNHTIRGIETGADVVNDITSWKWVSLQFHGAVDSNKLARVLYVGGRIAIYKVGAYDAVNNMTFLTYELDTPYTYPLNSPLSVTF